MTESPWDMLEHFFSDAIAGHLLRPLPSLDSVCETRRNWWMNGDSTCKAYFLYVCQSFHIHLDDFSHGCSLPNLVIVVFRHQKLQSFSKDCICPLALVLLVAPYLLHRIANCNYSSPRVLRFAKDVTDAKLYLNRKLGHDSFPCLRGNRVHYFHVMLYITFTHLRE